MEITSLCWCLLLAGCLQLAAGDSPEVTPKGESAAPSESNGQEVPPNAPSADPKTDPLFLTPLIEACNFSEAKEKSNVTYFKQYGINATAHSGYITVNETTKNHLFFLLIEAEENPDTAPLMLWTQGGPGLSALFGLLLQNGPLSFDYEKNFSRRDLTIQKHVSMIYLDAPVGAGFSFTENITGYPKLLPDVIIDIKEFLRQFLELFSEYKQRAFYIGGDSYAARYAVGLAQYMLMKPQELNLTLQGIIGGVGFLAPIFQLADSSEFLFQASMLDDKRL
uniref:Putative serine carboxypeptidase cpvl n=1 Tax=Amblyomma triste TaxID=251400 RepID=A0A023GBE4_AMBTT